jgi:hypothetical protein
MARPLLMLCAAACTAAAAAASPPTAAARPLTKVHIVAHSHNDPGWLETESEYFQTRTAKILTNVVASLHADQTRVFHWVEMVYFREWWGEQPGPGHAGGRAPSGGWSSSPAGSA